MAQPDLSLTFSQDDLRRSATNQRAASTQTFPPPTPDLPANTASHDPEPRLRSAVTKDLELSFRLDRRHSDRQYFKWEEDGVVEKYKKRPETEEVPKTKEVTKETCELCRWGSKADGSHGSQSAHCQEVEAFLQHFKG